MGRVAELEERLAGVEGQLRQLARVLNTAGEFFIAGVPWPGRPEPTGVTDTS